MMPGWVGEGLSRQVPGARLVFRVLPNVLEWHSMFTLEEQGKQGPEETWEPEWLAEPEEEEEEEILGFVWSP